MRDLISALVSVLLAMLFLGLPFYWGTLGHGVITPIVWAIVVAVVVNIRRQRAMNEFVVASFFFTLVLSLATCLIVFEIGHLLS